MFRSINPGTSHGGGAAAAAQHRHGMWIYTANYNCINYVKRLMF